MGCVVEDEPREVSPIRRPTWTANPLLVAYVVVIMATLGLLVNRHPEPEEALPVVAATGQPAHEREREATEPPLWLQLFRPSPPTARLLLRTALPALPLGGGSSQQRNLRVLWTGPERPQTLFQVALPFLRSSQQVATQPPATEPRPPVTTPPALNPKPPVGGGAPTPSAPTRTPVAQEPERQVVAGGMPLIGIYHTHDWESYLSEFPALAVNHPRDLGKIASYDHSLRTVVDIGQVLALRLRDMGVTTVHAPFRHQELGYDYAYSASRNTARQILKEAPSVKVLLDLHRDGTWGLDSTTQIQGEDVARIRCVIGKREDQPNWEQNKRFCDALIDRLENAHPGLTLPTVTQEYRYNQDLIPGAILLEIGNATNRYEEAERAVGYLAEVLVEMIREDAYPK